MAKVSLDQQGVWRLHLVPQERSSRIERLLRGLRTAWAWWQVQYQRGMVTECANQEKAAARRGDFAEAQAWLDKGMRHRFRQGMRQRELAKMRQEPTGSVLMRLEWRKVAGVGWDER